MVVGIYCADRPFGFELLKDKPPRIRHEIAESVKENPKALNYVLSKATYITDIDKLQTIEEASKAAQENVQKFYTKLIEKRADYFHVSWINALNQLLQKKNEVFAALKIKLIQLHFDAVDYIRYYICEKIRYIDNHDNMTVTLFEFFSDFLQISLFNDAFYKHLWHFDYVENILEPNEDVIAQKFVLVPCAKKFIAKRQWDFPLINEGTRNILMQKIHDATNKTNIAVFEIKSFIGSLTKHLIDVKTNIDDYVNKLIKLNKMSDFEIMKTTLTEPIIKEMIRSLGKASRKFLETNWIETINDFVKRIQYNVDVLIEVHTTLPKEIGDLLPLPFDVQSNHIDMANAVMLERIKNRFYLMDKDLNNYLESLTVEASQADRYWIEPLCDLCIENSKIDKILSKNTATFSFKTIAYLDILLKSISIIFPRNDRIEIVTQLKVFLDYFVTIRMDLPLNDTEIGINYVTHLIRPMIHRIDLLQQNKETMKTLRNLTTAAKAVAEKNNKKLETSMNAIMKTLEGPIEQTKKIVRKIDELRIIIENKDKNKKNIKILIDDLIKKIKEDIDRGYKMFQLQKSTDILVTVTKLTMKIKKRLKKNYEHQRSLFKDIKMHLPNNNYRFAVRFE